MAIVTGKIKKVEDLSQGVHLKNKLTIKTIEGGLVFIEFRGAMKKVSDNYRAEDDVIIEHSYDGKTSHSGVSFNNLPGTSIKKIN